MLLQLSWSHLVELIAIDDPWKRAFFENECLLANWSVRQIGSHQNLGFCLQANLKWV